MLAHPTKLTSPESRSRSRAAGRRFESTICPPPGRAPRCKHFGDDPVRGGGRDRRSRGESDAERFALGPDSRRTPGRWLLARHRRRSRSLVGCDGSGGMTTARGRAARGTGVVEQRSTGWFVRRSEMVDGHRRRWFDGPFETQRDALRSSPVLASHRQTIDAGEWITDWARMRAEQLRSRDRYSTAKIVERHVRIHLASPSHVSAIAEALNSTGRTHRAGAALGAGVRLATRYPSSGRNARTLSPKTIRNILSTLSSAMKTAVDDDLPRSNPVRDAEIIALVPAVLNDAERTATAAAATCRWAQPCCSRY